MPCHHALAEALRAYIDAAGIAEDRNGWLFRRAKAAAIAAEIGYHTFRATGMRGHPNWHDRRPQRV